MPMISLTLVTSDAPISLNASLIVSVYTYNESTVLTDVNGNTWTVKEPLEKVSGLLHEDGCELRDQLLRVVEELSGVLSDRFHDLAQSLNR